MKAIVFDDGLRLSVNEPKPVPPPGEALIRVVLAGICNTDIEITRGYMDFRGIPGHEFVGIVEEIHDSDQRLLGRRVVGDINCACRRDDCPWCSQGLGRHCPRRTTLGISGRNGCLAEYLTLPLTNLMAVPDGVADENAVFAEPLAAAFEILDQVKIGTDNEVLILGDGKLGLLIAHALSTTGASVTLAGKHPDKMKIASALGCAIALANNLNEKEYDIVVEATGSVNGPSLAIRHVRPRGTVVLKSTLAAPPEIDLNAIVVNEITVVGSRCGLFGPALNYLQGGVDFSPLIGAVYPADQALIAFEAAGKPGALKMLVRFQ